MLNRLGSKEIYVKFFDLKMINGRVEPVAKVEFKTSGKGYTFIPCVFISNDIFVAGNVNPENLAVRTMKLIHSLAKNNKVDFKEVQFDCDWTAKSKENYFRFLKKSRSELKDKKLLSATIRLHQYKYYNKTGVPPVDKGVLMCYNVGEIENRDEVNSIIRFDLVKQYLKKGMSYPLQTSIALPIFKWALVFRLGQLSSIINNVDKTDMKGHLTRESKNLYLIKDNFYLKGQFLSRDDEVRFEQVGIEELEKIADYVSALDFDKLIYYHLSQSNIEKYDIQQLSEINSTIHR